MLAVGLRMHAACIAQLHTDLAEVSTLRANQQTHARAGTRLLLIAALDFIQVVSFCPSTTTEQTLFQ
jgi:uncharacterized protein YcgI (DUF1989 family)